MDVLLQNINSGQYLKHDLTWAARTEDAFAFISSGEAIDFAFEHHLANVQIVLYFKDLRHSLVVPFQAENGIVSQQIPSPAKLDRPAPL